MFTTLSIRDTLPCINLHTEWILTLHYENGSFEPAIGLEDLLSNKAIRKKCVIIVYNEPSPLLETSYIDEDND